MNFPNAKRTLTVDNGVTDATAWHEYCDVLFDGRAIASVDVDEGDNGHRILVSVYDPNLPLEDQDATRRFEFHVDD